MLLSMGGDDPNPWLEGAQYSPHVHHGSSIHLFFLQKLIRQRRTTVMSFHRQFEKEGRKLLREAFESGGSALFAKRGGKRKNSTDLNRETNCKHKQ